MNVSVLDVPIGLGAGGGGGGDTRSSAAGSAGFCRAFWAMAI
jgi:hypothetical protein